MCEGGGRHGSGGVALVLAVLVDEARDGLEAGEPGRLGRVRLLWFLPYWVMKARQLSTMMGMSFLLSCCSRRVFPRPPAARWMSRYQRVKSDRAEPCRWSVLSGETEGRREDRQRFGSGRVCRLCSHLPFSTRTRTSLFSWFSVSEVTPLTHSLTGESDPTRTGRPRRRGGGWGLTELLQPVEVDDVLGGAVSPWADEEVGPLQDEEGFLPVTRVQHGPVPQQTHPLKLPGQQAVAAEWRHGLRCQRSEVRDEGWGRG